MDAKTIVWKTAAEQNIYMVSKYHSISYLINYKEEKALLKWNSDGYHLKPMIKLTITNNKTNWHYVPSDGI